MTTLAKNVYDLRSDEASASDNHDLHFVTHMLSLSALCFIGPITSTPRRAHSSFCSSVGAPLTPIAPSTFPPRLIGKPPGRRITANPCARTPETEDLSKSTSDSSPLGMPRPAEAMAFPTEP